ncbi:hypothetical protein QFC22_002386 [Naganishia vaughanmartiniae]|uniref:Uncharacterized protein n=1 Tax=Naganishia vaughanmartiniae TaxID=1424756 RepID=A0ACC2XCI4_9TREE|nr:hypothetical protein QFC22_002386 [Naganishia vaughanmartiniae]
MFWRYGFDTTSSLDTLLNRVDLNDNDAGYDDQSSGVGRAIGDGQSSAGTGTGSGAPPTVEELLEEQELLNELKVKNPKLVKVLSSKDSIRSLLSWSIYGIDDLEAKIAEEWQNAQLEAEARGRERKASENTYETEGAHSVRENGNVAMLGSTLAEGESPHGEFEQDDTTKPTISYSRIHLPEIIPRLTTHTVIPTDAEGEAKRQRFSQIATEVLCADVWEIQSKLASDFPGFLRPFWEAALGYGTPDVVVREVDDLDDTMSEEAKREQRERFAVVQQIYEARHVSRPSSSTSGSPDGEDKRREILRNNFARVNYTLFAHHGAAVFAFIQTLPGVLARILDRIESTAMQDLVLKLVSLEEQGVRGVISWLASESLIQQLYRRLSPCVNATTHTVIYELVKTIVALSSSGTGPSVGGFNPDGGNGHNQNAQAGQPQQQILSSPTDSSSQASTHQVGGAGGEAAAAEEGSGAAPRNNELIRDMVRKENVDLLIRYMFDTVTPSELDDQLVETLQEQDGQRSPRPSLTDELVASSSSTAYSFDPYDTPRLPSNASINSSFCNIINVFIELIRKNNSDFAEPHLFHTMRNRLIGMKQRAVEDRAAQREGEKTKQAQDGEAAPVVQTEEELDEIDRATMETVMAEMSERMGIVHLGFLMEALSGKVDKLQDMIENPKSLNWSRTPGVPRPLTQERFRIMELYAEMLHCSNMSILNRQPGEGPVYSSGGCLVGGLEALEKLRSALEGEREQAENGKDEDDQDDDIEGHVQKARELPVSLSGSTTHSRPSSDHADRLDNDETSDVRIDGNPDFTESETVSHSMENGPPAAPPPPSQADVARLRDVMVQHPRVGALGQAPSTAPDSEAAAAASNVAVASTAVSSVKDETMEDVVEQNEGLKQESTDQQATGFADDDVLPVGGKLKQLLIRHHAVRSVVNLFFEYPLHNFLHNVVYDIIQQILNGHITSGFNRELIIDLFNEARLVRRILDANEPDATTSARHFRPGYMGHLLLIGEEVEKFLDRCSPDLYLIIKDSFDRSDWDTYVNEMKQDKIRDSQPLGGTRPQHTLTQDEESDSSDEDTGELSGALAGQPLTRAMSSGEAFKSSFGYGTESGDNDQNKGDQFSRYFMRETHSNSLAFSDDDSDDSSSESPRVAVKGGGNPRRLSEGFDDAFSPETRLNDMDDDDAWGEFTSASGPSSGGEAEDPFGDSFAAPAAASSSRNFFSHQTPFTSADFAEQALKKQLSDERNNTWTGSDEQSSPIEVPDGVMGDDSFESAAQFLAANWSIPGGDVGENLPPTMGSISLAIETPASRRRSSVSSASSGSTASPSSSPDNRGMHPAAKIGRRNSRHQYISPPDASLINATSEDARLGPGVSPDTHVRPDGLLEREVNGQRVTAAQDDISLAATHHIRKHHHASL